jgi:uncharacterized protein DUF1206
VSKQMPIEPVPIRRAKAGGEKVARSRGFEWFTRAGFVSRGLIYGIIGVLAVKLALGDGGETTNQQGALTTIAYQPFGKLLLILVAVGLAGYSLWRLTRALLGHGPESSDSTLERVAALGSGIAYAGICAGAIKILLGSGGSSSDGATKTTAGVFGWPAGTWLVGIAGTVLISVGLYQGYRGLSRTFLQDSHTGQMSASVRKAIEWLGVIGHLARMVVFVLIGIFLIKAAIDFNPNDALGLDGALAKLAHNSYGPLLLGLVAAGLVAFALYSLSDARYRKI